jgi:hypothetical protein
MPSWGYEGWGYVPLTYFAWLEREYRRLEREREAARRASHELPSSGADRPVGAPRVPDVELVFQSMCCH